MENREGMNLELPKTNHGIAEDNVKTAEMNVTIAENAIAAANRNLLIAKQNKLAFEQSVIKARSNVNIADSNLEMAELIVKYAAELAGRAEGETVAEADMTDAEKLAAKNLAIAEKNLLTANENLLTAAQNASAAETNAANKKYNDQNALKEGDEGFLPYLEYTSLKAYESFSSPAEIKEKYDTAFISHAVYDNHETAKENLEILSQGSFQHTDDPYADFKFNTRRSSEISRCEGVMARFDDKRETEPCRIHVVKLGDIAFTSCPHELYIDYQHRIQARSPFVQTFMVQLASSEVGAHGYLATERAAANKGYSAISYSCHVSPKGGQAMVERTLEILNDIKE